MRQETLLLRQINPNFIQDGRVTSQAFRPTPKDEFYLSVDDGDRIAPEAAWSRFNANLSCRSVGVQAITLDECSAEALPVIEDGNPHPEHCSIDFSGYDKGSIERKAKVLREQARVRGWLFKGQ